MIKRLYDWITKANQVLLFFLIIGAAIGISCLFYDLYRTRHILDEPRVAIAQTPEEAKASGVVQEVRDGIHFWDVDIESQIKSEIAWK